MLHLHSVAYKNCGFPVNNANVVGLTHQEREVFLLMSEKQEGI